MKIMSCLLLCHAADNPMSEGQGEDVGEVGNTRLLHFIKGKDARVSRHRAWKLRIKKAFTVRKTWQIQNLILVGRDCKDASIQSIPLGQI